MQKISPFSKEMYAVIYLGLNIYTRKKLVGDENIPNYFIF